MKKFFLALIALCTSPSVFAQESNNICPIAFNAPDDLRDVLFRFTARSIATNSNIDPELSISGQWSDDHYLGFRNEGIEALQEFKAAIKPKAYRYLYRTGIIRFVGDPCSEHDVSFEILTENPSNVWKVEAKLNDGRIVKLVAILYLYEEIGADGLPKN
jgi:hypothetical protein